MSPRASGSPSVGSRRCGGGRAAPPRAAAGFAVLVAPALLAACEPHPPHVPDAPPVHDPSPARFEVVEDAWGLDWDAPPPDVLPETMARRASGGGAALADLDADGDLDLLLTAPFGPNALYLANADGRFARVPSPLDDVPETFGVVAADLDGDALPEILLAATDGVRLFANDGAAAFTELPRPLTVDGDVEVVTSLALADYDADGLADVLVGGYGVSVDPVLVPVDGYDRLLRATSATTFEEVPLPATGGSTLAVTWLDADADGDLDGYSVKDFGAETVPNALYLQGDDGAFTEAAAAFGLDAGFNGMGVDQGDLDRDGRVELVMSDGDRRIQVYELSEDGPAVDVAAEFGAVPADP